ncbi:MFS general substrate transporter [Mollisia scopiformis]|uniref:MFS general substrate transporter n=1 Tax=Mollisia scopiformis TaxID=149040 RepID=A0A132BDM9_MOLSC|nr:MFS general substrate transporter [Mollisia scopiformis]KUJ10491.1 MFS general substrate transporter [Mollisia scopiformis]
MDTRPKLPQKAFRKEGEDFDALEDRKIGNGSTLKFGSQNQMEMMRADTGDVFPRPSSSHADPLNWVRWRKELAFASLMLATATIGSLKTMFVTVNAVIATELNSSYTGAAALTGVPLIIGAMTGVKSQILSQTIGKRGIYLVSSIVMLLAAVWNMHVTSSYAEFMISRIFQGMGWGAFEALVGGSINDLFFVHERSARMNAYNVVNMLFLWGSPILGGFLSQSTQGFRNQIMVVNIIQAFSIVFLILGAPETTFDRTTGATPPAENAPSGTPFKLYLNTLKLKTQHSTRPFSITRAMQPLKALYAPSTLLTMLLSAPLFATSFGIAESLSLIFTSMPTFLFPSRLGFLFILPLIFSLLTYTISSYIIYIRSKPPHHLSPSASNITLGVSIPGLVLAVAGLLSLGLYTEQALMPTIVSDGSGSVFALLTGADISLKTVSALFGILVAGSVVLTYASTTHLSCSQSSTAKASLLTEGTRFWEQMLAGIWTIGMPMWVQGATQEGMTMVMGFKETAIALAVLSVVLSSSVGALLWSKGREIRGVDARVLGRVEENEGEGQGQLKRWNTGDSFMDV